MADTTTESIRKCASSSQRGDVPCTEDTEAMLLNSRLLGLILAIYIFVVGMFCLVNYWPQPE